MLDLQVGRVLTAVTVFPVHLAFLVQLLLIRTRLRHPWLDPRALPVHPALLALPAAHPNQVEIFF